MTETGEDLRGIDQAEALSHGKVLDSPEEEFRTVSASPTPTGSSKTTRRASLKHTMVPNTAKYEASPSHRRGSGLIKESIPISSESLEVMHTVVPARKKSQPQIEIHTAKTAMTGRRVPVSDGILSKDEGLEREEDSDGIQLFRQLNFSGESPPMGGSTWSEKRKTRKRTLPGEDMHSSPSRGFEDPFSDPPFSHTDSRRRLSHPHATPFESIPSPDSSTYSEASPPSPIRSLPSLPGSLKKASPTSTPMRRSLSPGFHRSFLLTSSSSEMWSPPLALNFDEPAFSKKRSGYRKGLELSDGTDSFLESSTSATHLDSRSKSMGRQTSTSLPSEKLMVSQSTQRDSRSIASTPSPTSSSTNSTVSHVSSATPSPHVVQIPKFSVTLSNGTSDTSYQSPVATLVRRSQLSPAPQFELRSTQTSSKSSPSLLDFTSDSSDYSLTKKIGTAGSSPQLVGTAQSSPQTGKISGASSAAQTPSGVLPKDRLVLAPKSLPQSGASSPSPRSEPIQRTSWSTGHKQLKDGFLVLSPDPKAFEDEQTLRRNERARRNSNSAARRRLVTCPPTPERRLPRMGRLPGPSQSYQPTLATPPENPDPVEEQHVYDRGLNLNLTLEMMGPKKNRKKDAELLPEIETHTPTPIISPTTPQQAKSTTTSHGTPSPPIPTALFPDFSDSTLSLIPDSPAKKFKSEVEDQSDTKQEPTIPLWDSRILGGLEVEGTEGSPSRSGETEEMSASEFNDPQLIGEGAFFEVFRVSDARSGKFYAIKKAKRVFKGERDREDYLKEFRLVRGLGPQPNIIQHYLCWQEEGYFFLQMEYAEDNLRDYVDAKLGGAPSDSFVLKLCRQLAMALDHLHKAGLLHLDIKSENVLVTKDELFKLCDFGQASMKKDWKPGENEGDSQYIAPEVLNGHQDGGLGATPKADIYSLGLLLFQLRTGTELPTGGALWRALRTDESQIKPAELLQDVREKPLTPKFDIDSSFSTPPFRYSTVSERSAVTEEKAYGFDDVPEISLSQTLLSTPPSSRRSLAPKHSSKKDSKPSLIALDTHDPSIVCRLFSSPRKPGTEKKSEGLLEFSPEKLVIKTKESKASKPPKESLFDMESSEPISQSDKLLKVKEEIDGLILSLIHPNPSCRPNAKAVIGAVKQLEAKLEMLIPSMRVSDSPEWLSSGISTMDLGP